MSASAGTVPLPPTSSACTPARETPASAASVVVNTATVGVPSAAERCVSPVSTPTTASACRASVASSGSVCRGGTIAPGRRKRGAGCAPARSRFPTAAAGRSRRWRSGARSARQRSSGHSLSARLVAWNTQRVAPRGHGGGRRRRRELPARRSRHRVSQRRGRERAALVDEVLVARNGVVDVVEQRRQRFADAVPVEAVARPACDARDDRALHLLLQVEDRRVRFPAQREAKRTELAPCLARATARRASGATPPG